ncbi:hypothetical protein GGI07_000951 [Coemansia sp. Benny D115]|nr:hypothetical protein GGI07_000951 [Coemansia sp. Benny D115]
MHVASPASVIASTLESLRPELRTLSLAIHDNPELALQEHQACARLTEYLASKGFEVTKNVASLSTAFKATYTSPYKQGDTDSGLNLGFCSEYDALPGIGHGCGHNLIAISGVALFLALVAVMKECRLFGSVTLFGTPAEEAEGGKILMHEKGVFAGMDLLMMLHPAAGFSGTWRSQCLIEMQVEYFGLSSHAAMAPWEGVNAGSAAIIAMQTLGVLREQLKPGWLTHGVITHAGEAPNVIPAYSRIAYTVRTGVAADLKVLRERVLRVFASAAMATGCTHRVVEEAAYLDNLDNPVLGALYEDIMQETYPDETPVRGLGGSTDFGNLSHEFVSLHAMFDLDGSRDFIYFKSKLEAYMSRAHRDPECYEKAYEIIESKKA